MGNFTFIPYIHLHIFIRHRQKSIRAMSILDHIWGLSYPIVCSLAVPKIRGKIPKTMQVFFPASNEL